MSLPFISFEEGEALADWLALTRALRQGHSLPKAQIADTFLYRDPDTLLSRSAWIDGLGVAVKTATIFPENTDRPAINGAVTLFNDHHGCAEALVDFHLVTKWKTAGDSLLAALQLARSDSREILIMGAGSVAGSLIEAFGAGFPDARFSVWNRTLARAKDLASKYNNVSVVENLEKAVRDADIILGATMSTEPILKGEWLQTGQHVNLIGAYRPDMREVDDAALRRARIYVDSFETTLDHIGELKIPLSEGVIDRSDVLADYYALDAFERGDSDTITLFKNGGGAHLDLMVSQYFLDLWRATQ